MIKILDRYIIKKFLSTFLFMIIAFVVIAVVFDVSDHIDDLSKADATFFQIVFVYYASFAFYFGNLLSSFIIFLTIIWFTSKLAQQTEIVAMLSSGISYRRFIRPYFIAAGILVCTSLLLNHYIVPIANKQKYDFEVKHLRDAINVDESNIHREVEPGTIAYFYKVTPSTQSGSNFSLERWKEGRLVWKLVASGATYFPQEKKWTINNAQIREIHEDSTEATWYRQKMDTTLNLTIDDFGLRKEIMTAMTDSELDAFIEVQRMSGSGRTVEFELEKHNRTANSFSIFVLTLIGVSIASRKQRGGSGVHLMIGIIVGFCNVFVSRFLAVSAITAGFPVLLAAWLPNVIFLFVGLYFYSRAQK